LILDPHGNPRGTKHGKGKKKENKNRKRIETSNGADNMEKLRNTRGAG
jgi:hypothetical protein